MFTKAELYRKATVQLLLMPFSMAALIFIPAGTINYWQGWLFITVFSLSILVITLYLAIYDPALLARRMNAGPLAEKDKKQKIIMTFAFIIILAYVICSVLDHRFNWSSTPAVAVFIGNALIVLGFLIVFIVFRENTYTASTIEVEKNQKVITTGLYSYIRHPMYSGSLIMLFGVPLALGSWLGLFLFVILVFGIIWRLLEEEKYLEKNLSGYNAYRTKVRYRLIPYLW